MTLLKCKNYDPRVVVGASDWGDWGESIDSKERCGVDLGYVEWSVKYDPDFLYLANATYSISISTLSVNYNPY